MRVRMKMKARAGVSKDGDEDKGENEMMARVRDDDWGSKDNKSEGEADRTTREQCRE